MDICIIKEEAAEVNYYCLSPFCSDKHNRKFGHEDRHLLREQCKKWIVDEERLRATHQPLPAKAINNLLFDFNHRPVQAFELLSRLRVSEWRKAVDGEEAKAKKEMVRAIEVEFEVVREKMEQLLDNSLIFEKACQIIRSHSEPSTSLNDFYDQHLVSLTALQSKVLFKKTELKVVIAEIKQQMEKIFQSMIEAQKESEGLLSHQEQRSFHEFVFQPTQQYFNKLQVLASALKKGVPVFRPEENKLLLQCYLCGRAVRTVLDSNNKKTAKKYLAEQMLTHIYCSHYDQAAFAFTRRISKAFLAPVTFQEFLQSSRRCSRIVIVDRDSGVQFEEEHCDGRVSVEVVSVRNVGMARGRHILVENHHSTEYLTAILAYVCTQRDQNVEIVTKRPTLKAGIQDLLECKTKQQKYKVKQELKRQ